MIDILSSTDILIGSVVGLVLLYAFIVYVRHAPDRHVLTAALTMKLLLSIVYCVYLLFIYQGGDSFYYAQSGQEYAAALRADWAQGNLNHLFLNPPWQPNSSSTDRFINLTGVLSFLLHDSFLAMSFIFAVLGFFGQLLLYRVFVEQYPDPHLRRWWQVGILFFPSVVFWTAGLLKDPLGLLGTALVMWGAIQAFSRARVAPLVAVALGMVLLALFRSQVLPVLLVTLAPIFLRSTALQQQAHGLLARVMQSRTARWMLVALGFVGVLAVGVLDRRYALAQLPNALIEQSHLYELIGAQSSV
ncbi:MAG: hypothetical protein LC737_11115, partial [Chloroflexi bacterium]|nr:hypothetical protein [Chloroflexota bacterium]